MKVILLFIQTLFSPSTACQLKEKVGNIAQKNKRRHSELKHSLWHTSGGILNVSVYKNNINPGHLEKSF